MTERLDALLSARRDGALDAAEASELERLLAGSDAESEAARQRARELEGVDEALRRLAARGIPAERLDRSRSVLERRLRSAATAGGRHQRVSKGRWLGWGFAAVAAMAALWIVSLLLADVEGGLGSRSDVALEVATSEDVAVEDLASLGVARASDLEVIEELELLEFLAERERMAEEPQG